MTDSEKDHVRELVRGLGINAVADLMRIVRKEAEALAAAGELDLAQPPHFRGWSGDISIGYTSVE
jgi:hypothetical protein